MVYGLSPLRKRRVASRMTINMSARWPSHNTLRVHQYIVDAMRTATTIDVAALIRKGIRSLPCIGDGRQSGTSGSPSILNASPVTEIRTAAVSAVATRALARPDWHCVFDVDREKGAEARKRIFDMVAADRLPVSAFHMPFPSIGYVERMGPTSYRWVPHSYQFTIDAG